MRDTSLGRVVLAITLMTVCSPPTWAASYRHQATTFTIDLPADWVEIPAVEMNMINQFAQTRGLGKDVEYLAGFRPKNLVNGGYPYILIQAKVGNTRGSSYEEIEQAFGAATQQKAEKKVQDAMGDILNQVKFNQFVLDRTTNRLTGLTSSQVIGIGSVHGLSVGHLGADGVVFVHAYATDVEFNQHRPAFDAINASAKFDAGHEFQAGKPAWRAFRGGAISGGIIGGLCGGVAAAILGVIRGIRKKIEQSVSPEPPSDTPAE